MIPSLSSLWDSTANLYSRFGLKPSVKNAENGILEECLEVLEQLRLDTMELESLSEEVVDTIVVLISAMLARGLTLKDMERAMIKVMNKNNAKNWNTHVIFNEKITKREKVIATYENSD